MSRDPGAGHVERLMGEVAANRNRVGLESVAKYDRPSLDVLEQERPKCRCRGVGDNGHSGPSKAPGNQSFNSNSHKDFTGGTPTALT